MESNGNNSHRFHQGNSPNIRLRDQFYRLLVSQLFYDGHAQLAKSVANTANIIEMCPPSDRLFQMFSKSSTDHNHENHSFSKNVNSDFTLGIDMDFETERSSTSTISPSKYETVYVTSHKCPCRAGAFSPDGQLVATGSVDASIKIIDVERMIAKSNQMAGQQSNEDLQQTETHPVIRTLYDHMEEISTLVFHPKEQFLISGSHDMTIKLFDYSKPSVKRAFKSVQEADIVRALAIHRSGDYLLVGSQHPTIRLYCLPTFQCFISPVITDQHKGPVTALNYSPNSQIYVSSSKDGDIRLWDGISNRCVTVLPKAHDGFEICSVVFSRNGKYILSSGKDSMVKLWELSMSRCLIAYTGTGRSNTPQQHRLQACFDHTEDYVMMPDEKNNSLWVWDSRSAERRPQLNLSHNQPVRHFCHSPTMPAFLSCSEDYRARFWLHKSNLIT